MKIEKQITKATFFYLIHHNIWTNSAHTVLFPLILFVLSGYWAVFKMVSYIIRILTHLKISFERYAHTLESQTAIIRKSQYIPGVSRDEKWLSVWISRREKKCWLEYIHYLSNLNQVHLFFFCRCLGWHEKFHTKW